MIERFEILKISNEQKELLSLADWAWNSHYWIEEYPGYCKCKWCGKNHTSEMSINWKFPICRKNPAIKNFISERMV